MQVLIGNKLYDTLQNKQVACRKNGFESTDPRWQHEDLFLTENNEYFLIGRGGADSDYCHTINNQKCSGDKAILLTEQQATEWLAREHLVKGPNSCFFYRPILKGPQAESRQAP